MADAYRYPLTRICLRTGALTLPLNLLGVFPERGEVVALDPQKDTEYTLRVEGRRVLGLEPFFAAHDLTPNDELTIRPLEDGRFAFTAVTRPRRPDFTRPEVVGRLLDALVDAGLPMSEAEIRDLHPELPVGFPLRQALEREPRLTLHEGRWQPRLPEPRRRSEPARPADVPRPAEPPRAAPAAEPAEVPGRADRAGVAGERERAEDQAARRAAARARAERDAGADRGPRERPQAEATRAGEAEERADRERADRERADRERADREDAARARGEVEAALEAQAKREAEIMALVQADELAMAVASAEAASAEAASAEAASTEAASTSDDAGPASDVGRPVDEARRRTRERLVAHAEDDALAAARRQRDDRAERRRSETGEDAPESFSWDQPLGRRLRFPWLRRREEPKETAAPEPLPLGGDPLKLDRLGEPRPVDRSAAPPRVSPAPRAGLFPADVGLNSASLPPGDPALTKRAREAFTTLGYRVEGLAHGQLMLHADFGRRFERVLVHVLPEGQRLDWAALLARRRESGAGHLAVVGDHRDLHRLVAPADLAKATLWSWVGLDRVLELAGAMPIGPFDLEPHFERDGLFEYGLDRFERTIAKRVQERGAVSAVLERLALLKAPAVFLLEDVAGSADVPREQALRVLERLAEAPWHLVSRIDSGEFCLRYRVQDALDQIGAYAASLRARLPERQRDRVRGLPDDLDPIQAADVPASAAAPSGTASPAASAPAEPSQTAPGSEAPARLFAGPGLGPEEEADPDEVDVSLVAVKRPRRRS